MKKLLFVGLAALFLTGCPETPRKPADIGVIAPPTTVPVQLEKPQQPVKPVEPTKPAEPKSVVSFIWPESVSPLVNQMTSATEVSDGNVLLVDSVSNNTNGSIKTPQATSAIHSVLASNSKFKVVPEAAAAAARQALGLSSDDGLKSRSKAIGLARYVHAQYVLYTTLTGSAKDPTLSMQLLSVLSGELMWSGKGAVEQRLCPVTNGVPQC